MENTIKCCVCGQEYLPSEIFIPNEFFGKQTNIFKNDSGNVEFYLGSDMNLEEDYICDNCGANLHIKANLSFDVTSDKQEKNIEEEYTSTFEKPKKLLLEEELF